MPPCRTQFVGHTGARASPANKYRITLHYHRYIEASEHAYSHSHTLNITQRASVDCVRACAEIYARCLHERATKDSLKRRRALPLNSPMMLRRRRRVLLLVPRVQLKSVVKRTMKRCHLDQICACCTNSSETHAVDSQDVRFDEAPLPPPPATIANIPTTA